MKKKGNDLSVGIRAVKASRSELFLIEKGLPAGFSRAGRLAKTNTGSPLHADGGDAVPRHTAKTD